VLLTNAPEVMKYISYRVQLTGNTSKSRPKEFRYPAERSNLIKNSAT
jgi:hypothetical protein